MGLKDRIRRLEQLFAQGDLPPTTVVFGLGPVEEWDSTTQRYRSERGVPFEPYVCFGEVAPALLQAKDLASLREVAGKFRVNLVVYPSGADAGALWADGPAADDGEVILDEA